MGILNLLLGRERQRQGPSGEKHKCPFCKAELTLDMKKCPKCGKPLSELFVIICPECKEKIPLNSEKCPNCGHDFAAPAPQRPRYNCPRCGYSADYYMLSCPSCGVKFSA